MLGEDAEHPLEMAAVDDQEPVETLGSDGADEALGNRVRLRRSDRRADDLDAFAAEDNVEVTRELAVAIPDQKAHRRRTLRQSPSELTGLLGDPGAARVGRAAGEMHPAAAELDDEENVQPAQGNGLDRKEVDGEHAVRLRPQELAPGEPGAHAGRPQTRLSQELAHGRG